MFCGAEGQFVISFHHDAVFLLPMPHAHTNIDAPTEETGSNTPSVSSLESSKLGEGLAKDWREKREERSFPYFVRIPLISSAFLCLP